MKKRFVVLLGCGLALTLLSACGKSDEQRIFDAIGRAGISVATTSQGAAHSGGYLITVHTIFATSDGRTGHVLRAGVALTGETDAASFTAEYVPGGVSANYMAWSSGGDRKSVVVLVDKTTWTPAQRDALDREIKPLK